MTTRATTHAVVTTTMVVTVETTVKVVMTQAATRPPPTTKTSNYLLSVTHMQHCIIIVSIVVSLNVWHGNGKLNCATNSGGWRRKVFLGEAGVPSTIKSWFCIDLLLSDPCTENETSKK